MRGFSLIELMVVIFILSLIMVVVPVAINRGGGSELKAVSRDMLSLLREARAEALTDRRSTAVWLDVSGHRYGLGEKEKLLPEEVLVDMEAIADDLSSASERALIRFYADGSSSGGSVELSAGGNAYKLKVDWLTGRVSLLSLQDVF
jgi:general secretion pathway protein H